MNNEPDWHETISYSRIERFLFHSQFHMKCAKPSTICQSNFDSENVRFGQSKSYPIWLNIFITCSERRAKICIRIAFLGHTRKITFVFFFIVVYFFICRFQSSREFLSEQIFWSSAATNSINEHDAAPTSTSTCPSQIICSPSKDMRARLRFLINTADVDDDVKEEEREKRCDRIRCRNDGDETNGLTIFLPRFESLPMWLMYRSFACAH